MEYLLFAVVLIQFGYLIWLTHTFNKEKKQLLDRLMSRNFEEYRETVEPESKPVEPPEPSPYVPVEEVSVDQLLQAKDNT